MAIKLEQMFNEIQQQGISSAKAVDLSSAASCALPAGTTIGGSSVAALGVITSSSANALAVGQNGATNPVLDVDASTSSAATGVKVKGAAAAAGVAVSAISSGTDENLTIDAKGAGTITLNGTATGAVVLPASVTVASAGKIAGVGTGANGIVLSNLKNAPASTLSGTNIDIAIDIGGTPYYFTVYPTKV
jgi:hypothetical protein